MEIRRGLAAVLALMSMGFLVRPFMELPSSNQLLLLLNLDISQPLSFQPAPAPAAAAPAPVPPGPVPVDAEDVEVATKGAEVAKAAEEAKAKEAEAAKAAKEAEAVQAKEAEAAQAAKEAEAAKAANAAKEAEAAKAAQEAEAAKAAQEAEAAKAAQAAAAKSEPLAERLRRHAGIYEDKTKAPELKNVLLLTAANSGYLEMLVNWECFAKRLGLDWMVMSMDSKLHQHLGEDRSFQATGQEWEEAAAFNSKVGFKVISCNKIRTVLEILRSTNLDLVFSDGDNVFKSDPFLPSLSLGSMIRSGQYEYIYGRKIEPGGQRIENLKPEVYHQEPIKANTGFYYVSGSPKKQSVVNKVFEAGVSWCNRRPDMDDQENFWDALVHVRRQTARDKDYVGCFRHCNNSACAGVDDSLVFNYCDMSPWEYILGCFMPDSALKEPRMVSYHATHVIGWPAKKEKLKMVKLWAYCEESEVTGHAVQEMPTDVPTTTTSTTTTTTSLTMPSSWVARAKEIRKQVGWNRGTSRGVTPNMPSTLVDKAVCGEKMYQSSPLEQKFLQDPIRLTDTKTALCDALGEDSVAWVQMNSQDQLPDPDAEGALFSRICTPGHQPQLIEPLAGMMRDPRFQCKSVDIFSIEWLVLGDNQTFATAPGAKRIMFDAGGSFFEHAMLFFTSAYEQRGLPFDEIYVWETNGQVNQVNYWQNIPPDWKAKYQPRTTFYDRTGISAKVGDKHNPMTRIYEQCRPQDFCVFKLDIDYSAVEVPIVMQILENPGNLKEFFFEYHVRTPIMEPWWKNGWNGTMADSYSVFQRLRQAGIRAHSWT
ncbi:unnamed protein product [Effrenium voratum]|uniref:Nucleotide-diphospho-sugar transferase domain-containing protein n=1 Tax=Effrenium voratum TaxID=2562239 RepID=A0AA36N5J4_9DINO|nr:unnamed protein product [Effrenium voratum]CAJ1443851.1 unnamed protein product [Effrenium voratum]